MNEFCQILIDFVAALEFLKEIGDVCRLFRMCREFALAEDLRAENESMTFRVWQPCKLLLIICVSTTFSIVFAQEDHSPRKPKVINFPSTNDAKQLYISVMGEIAKPGTYHLDSSSLNLHSVIERAGGVTSDASRVIRIVRNGKIHQKVFFSESINGPLLPGDLLIVESKQTSGTSQHIEEFEPEESTVHAGYQVRSSAPMVQIGVLNVANYPIVLQLRSDQANAGKIIQSLGQSTSLLANTHFITPDVYPRATSESAKQAITLTGGTVIVFDRDRVNRDRLPTNLPKPIESEIANGAQSSLIGSPGGQSTELRSLGQRVSMATTDSWDSRSQASLRQESELTNSLTPILSAPDTNEKLNSTSGGNSSRTNPRIAQNVPFTGTPQFSTMSSGSIRSDSDHEQNGRGSDQSVEDGVDNFTENKPSYSEEGRLSDTSARFTVNQSFVVLFIVGALFGSAILLRRTFKSGPVDVSGAERYRLDEVVGSHAMRSDKKKIVARSLLEQLINNELPIAFEHVEFPEGVTLQGRIVPRPSYRVDSAQSILKDNGPHFDSAIQMKSDAPQEQIIAELEPAEKVSVRRPHFMGQEKAKVTAAVGTPQEPTENEAVPVVDPLNTPLAKALFELEQGGRS